METTRKNALVLGATRGIGRAIAHRLAARGTNLIIPYFDWPEDTAQTISELQSTKANHLFVKTDLRSQDQIRLLFEKIKEKYSHLDILINNIERGGMPVVHGPYTPEQWDIEIDTTLKAKWLVFQEALPLLKSSAHGVSVTLSSIAGSIGRSGPAGLIFNEGYAAANRAIGSFTETWARQGAPEVRVNEIVLGFIETRHGEHTRGWNLLSEKQRQAILQQTLLQRTGTVKEVCDTIMFLIEEATFMTGSTITIDGGYTLGHSRVSLMPEGTDDLDIKM